MEIKNPFELKYEVFDRLANKLRTKYSGIFVSGEYVSSPSSFPAVTFEETANVINERTSDENIQNGIDVEYTINIYTNNIGTREKNAREIATDVDGLMLSLGFVRIYSNPVPNLADSTIYRMMLRYRGTVLAETMLNGTMYRVYRR